MLKLKYRETPYTIEFKIKTIKIPSLSRYLIAFWPNHPDQGFGLLIFQLNFGLQWSSIEGLYLILVSAYCMSVTDSMTVASICLLLNGVHQLNFFGEYQKSSAHICFPGVSGGPKIFLFFLPQKPSSAGPPKFGTFGKFHRAYQ